MHLAGEPDSSNLGPARARRRKRGADARRRGLPPLLWVLLGPERARRGEGVGRGGAAGNAFLASTSTAFEPVVETSRPSNR